MTEMDALTHRVMQLIASAQDEVDETDRVELLVTLLHRTAVELNKSARAKAAETKGQPEWGAWAGLQNTTRTLVLQASTCRDVMRKMKGGA